MYTCGKLRYTVNFTNTLNLSTHNGMDRYNLNLKLLLFDSVMNLHTIRTA
jgi:hypothetical protein